MESLIDSSYPLNVCRASAGTGKTFTLAAYYVGLLLSGVDYRSILAVTFTNNATSEMKERIMGYLYQLKEEQNPVFLEKAKSFMIDRTDDSDDLLCKRAGDCFKRMLLDYDNVHIQTIDSFLLTLQKGLAAILKLNASYTPELDTKRVITEAVDQMLTTDLTETAKNLLVNYVKANLEEDDKSDIRKALIMMADDLYNESVQMLDADHKIMFNAQAIERYRKNLDEQWLNNEDFAELRKLVSQMSEINADVEGSKLIRKAYNRVLKNLRASIDSPKSIDKKARFQGLSDDEIETAKNKLKNEPGDIVKRIIDATELSRRCLKAYNTYYLTKEFTYDLQLMSELRALIKRNLTETNKTLLAQTASLLCDALKEGDADFILEKAGIRYHHVLLDEFQDTSKLQWGVFDHLLKELVAGEGNSILVVGDIKQSIYRWRNGDWHTMAELGKEKDYYHDYFNKKFPPLVRNFRSSKEIVNFNLSLFKDISERYGDFAYYAGGDMPNSQDAVQVREIYDESFKSEKINEYYRSDDADKSGGYVCFRAFAKNGNTSSKPQMLANMFDEMERLLADGIAPEQMMVLVRYNADVDLITGRFKRLDAGNYPKLSKVSLATENSYKLAASKDVKTILAILYYLIKPQKNSIYKEIICDRLPNCELTGLQQQINLNAPLFETISDILRLYFCDEHGQYTGTEHAYIDTFLDYVRGYVASYGGNVEDFVTYWEDVLNDKSIPMNSLGAIRVMTVHKSKGLEAQTLFVPFCNWESEVKSTKEPKVWCKGILPDEDGKLKSFPIQYGLEMQQSAYQNEFERERHNLRVDNLNLLYVALTRARDNLFIYTECNRNVVANNSVGQYLLRYQDIKPSEFSESTVYVERVYGKIVKGVEKTASDGPFEFNRATECDVQLWSDGRQVRFIQSQEGQLYTTYGDEAYRLVDRMDEGTLCHDIFAHIHTLDELDRVLDEFESRGEIESAEQREKLKDMISSAWKGNEQMHGWFTDPWELQLENAIFDRSKEIRPDRVMIDRAQSKAIVLDYKFGEIRSEHKVQVRKYMQAMRSLGFRHVEGYLWYAKNEQGKQLKKVEEEQQ